MGLIKRKPDLRPVAVLGCGPSGLLAAHAVGMAGRQVRIFSMVKPSPIGGAQYLHRAIPCVTSVEPNGYIQHVVDGDAFTYQHKAYGGGPQPDFVSFSHVSNGMEAPAWSLRGVYQELWRVYEDRMIQAEITPEWMTEFLAGGEFSLVVNTIPKFALCKQQTHRFQRQPIQIVNECLPGTMEENIIWYDGTPETSWYRASYIFGTGSTEWGGHVRLPFPEHQVVRVAKPVGTDCDCWADEERLMDAGRFGTWRKGVLTHHAYEAVLDRLGVSEEGL